MLPSITESIILTTFSIPIKSITFFRKKKKNFKLIGYDLLHRNVSCLKEGAVDFLIAQQPTAQGYSGVESLCNHLIFKKEVKQCNYMPITLLAVENVDFYLDAHKK